MSPYELDLVQSQIEMALAFIAVNPTPHKRGPWHFACQFPDGLPADRVDSTIKWDPRCRGCQIVKAACTLDPDRSTSWTFEMVTAVHAGLPAPTLDPLPPLTAGVTT